MYVFNTGMEQKSKVTTMIECNVTLEAVDGQICSCFKYILVTVNLKIYSCYGKLD